MTLPASPYEILEIARRHAESGDAGEILSVINALADADTDQAFGIMRGSGNEMDLAEQLVAAAISRGVIDRTEGIDILDDLASQDAGARP